jgi:type II secretory pathway pseudopilin PulG
MYPNQEVEHRHVVVNTPGERRETITETTQEEPREFRLSPGVIAMMAILALVAIGLTLYVVNNNNENDAANRQALLEASQREQAQQPAVVTPPSQQPVIIQQPAPQQQAPVVIQQPAPSIPQEKASPLDDITIQDAATKRLTDDSSLAGISVIVISGKAVLTGTTDSAELKANAEKVVRAVQGVKSIDNQIVISNQ